jgi:hypothetical protein
VIEDNKQYPFPAVGMYKSDVHHIDRRALEAYIRLVDLMAQGIENTK